MERREMSIILRFGRLHGAHKHRLLLWYGQRRRPCGGRRWRRARHDARHRRRKRRRSRRGFRHRRPRLPRRSAASRPRRLAQKRRSAHGTRRARLTRCPPHGGLGICVRKGMRRGRLAHPGRIDRAALHSGWWTRRHPRRRGCRIGRGRYGRHAHVVGGRRLSRWCIAFMPRTTALGSMGRR